MKTLIFVLSTSKSGTTRLAHALHSIGDKQNPYIDVHHQIVDIRHIYLKWIKKRFSQQSTSLSTNDENKLSESVVVLLEKEFSKYLQGEGYFADISHYLASIYPIIDNMDIDTRSVHLTRSYFPHRTRVYGGFVNNIKITSEILSASTNSHIDYYYPAELSWCSDIEWDDYVAMSQFERLCWYWKFHQEYFLLGKREIFHVEDFNNRSLEILKILYPEATDEQKDIFNRELFYIPESPDKAIAPYTLKTTEEEKEIYERICGPTLKKLGYLIK